jgi:hypothetical protein
MEAAALLNAILFDSLLNFESVANRWMANIGLVRG